MNKTIMAIESLVNTAEKFRNSYFWSSPMSAGERRSYERKYSIPEFTWVENGHDYSASFTVSCSCRNVYASGDYKRDGKKTTLTAVKNSLNRLKAANC